MDPQLIAALLWSALGVAFAAMWIVALVDLVQRKEWEFPQDFGPNTRLVWSAIVVLLGGIGGTVYYVRVMRPYPRGWRGS